MDDQLLSPYNPKEHEEKIYKKWEDSGFFNPDALPSSFKERYSIIMPPPNANGRLHAGHGTDITIKDILIRFHRMHGKRTLLLPGADHAGFETQGVYEKKLQKEGRSRFGMEREILYKEIYAFVQENKHLMENDVRKLGASCDWSRNTFTLDPRIVKKVEDTFIKMYEDGLVYRGKRSIHWNPKYQTSLSDIETEFIEKKDPFYYFKYGPFTIGTTRPETKFGDKYIVVHPNDARYAQYFHRQEFTLPWISGNITATLIKDEVANPEIGSGAMTITPWHSAIDFDIAERHNLPFEQIIDWNGKLLPIAGECSGMRIEDAREKVVEILKEKGLLEKIDSSYTHTVRVCERTGVVVEPQVKDQWFIKMKPLTEKALSSLSKKEYRFVTKQHEKIFSHWMNNPLDWNISRQIVWGIRIPAYFNEKGDIKVSKENPGEGWTQDPDTFDTWFSSGQWPLLTLSYPEGKDMAFYPTNVMETGADLVFKWVPRMIMFGLYLTEKPPFKDIYFHGMVLDSKGKKMSKSKGNVLSPIDLAEEFGTDATRMSFIIANPPGADMPLSKEKVRAYKKFANKIWNIARFVLTAYKESGASLTTKIHTDDEKLLSDILLLQKDIEKDIENYRIYLAGEKLYHYIWHTFADTIIEESKNILAEKGEREKQRSAVLYILFMKQLKFLHPFMPFITEVLWQKLPEKNSDLLMLSQWTTEENKK
jgi:valyl-tRNA synthetase